MTNNIKESKENINILFVDIITLINKKSSIYKNQELRDMTMDNQNFPPKILIYVIIPLVAFIYGEKERILNLWHSF